MQFPEQVTIVEVGPRDGLQNEPCLLNTTDKVALIDQLSTTGLTRIETTSFVNPKWVPQMTDSKEVYTGIQKHQHISYSALVPNAYGMRQALAVGVKEICVFAAVSDAFAQKNTNCSIAESLERIRQVTMLATSAGIKIRGYLSCVFGCPYQGKVDEQKIIYLTNKLLELGCYEVSLGDTIGIASPGDVYRLLTLLQMKSSVDKIAMHFHNTFGQALANILMSLHFKIKVFDASVAGLGGCPYAKGSTGNVATEDVVYMLQGLNIKTNIDLDKLLKIDDSICQKLKRETQSQVAKARRSYHAT